MLAIALASVGGVSYAATAVTHVAREAAQAVAPAATKRPVKVTGVTAGGDQYRPGYGFGDPSTTTPGLPA